MTYTMRLHTASAVTLVACFAMTTGPSFAQEAQLTQPQDFSAIVADLSPAVVGIAARRVGPAGSEFTPEGGPFSMPDPFNSTPGQEAPDQTMVAGGSGFMISVEGHVVTNDHVVEGASKIEIVLADGTTRPAEMVGTDPATDIAVLKLADTAGITVAPWGDSDAMKPGAWTIAIGSPFGLGGTVTVGVLSATSRVIGAGPYDAFLQTDASINSGNSGGPLFNISGEVIGVNTAILSPRGGNVGIGFAVPSSIAQDVVQQLIDTGEVERGFIGVSLQSINKPLARALGLDSTQGAIVTGVEPGGPADTAGIEEGDVILAIDGEIAHDPRQISRFVAEITPGTEVPLTIFRSGEHIEVTLTLTERDAGPEAQEAMPSEGASIGIVVSPVPELVRRNLGLSEGEAIIVQNVQPGGPADEAGIMRGDVILSASGKNVETGQEMSAAWAAARDADTPLLLRINRGGSPMFLAVEAEQADSHE